MKKLLGIIILGLIFVGNAYSNDPYSEENRKKSKIKISCKIEEIVNYYNQEDAKPIDVLGLSPRTNVDLPSFIIETNSYEDEVWLNQAGIKAQKNLPSTLIFLTLQNTNKDDFVFAKKFTIKFKEKYKNGKEISFEISNSLFGERKELTLEYINEKYFPFHEASVASGGCHRIDPKNFDFEETVVQNEIRIAEYEAKKEKELLNKKKEELKKANAIEGKFELNCKDGVLYKAGRNPEPFNDTLNYFVDIKNYSYKHLNEKGLTAVGTVPMWWHTDDEVKIEYLISHEIPNGRMFSIYRFDKSIAQVIIYNRDIGELAVLTARDFTENSYQSTKSKLDKINKQIEKYKPEKDILGNWYYTVSNLGTQKQEYEKFQIVMSLIDIIGNTNVTKVVTAIYKCNKI